MKNLYYPFENLPLPYEYDAMEPFIDTKTMMLHHDRHLQTYIDNLNAVLKENPPLQKLSLIQLITESIMVPADVRTKVKNNAGGVFNHRFYFDMLKNPSELKPYSTLGNAINKYFGNFETFREKLTQAALSVFGSGYAWLVCRNGKLEIVTSANQGSPIENGFYPILTIDVWEHAYYLKHYNKRADYIADWFNVINWAKAEENYIICFKGK